MWELENEFGEGMNEEDESMFLDFNKSILGDAESEDILPPIPTAPIKDSEEETILPIIPTAQPKSESPSEVISDGNFVGFDITDEEQVEVNTAPVEHVVPSEFSIDPMLATEQFDDFSILAETELKFPYLVFSAKGNFRTVASLCSGILTKGDTTLYFRPEEGNLNKLVHVTSVAATPMNIRNLLRMAMKDSVYYRKDATSCERLALPEQFIRYINLGLVEDASYWENLIKEETSPQTDIKEFDVEDLFG